MSDGLADFQVPGIADTCHTWYKVVGDLNSGTTPLVILHGGPGACHDYLLPLTNLTVPLIFYDQIGNGKSTHLPEKNGDESFWTVQLFMDELDNLLRHLGLDSRPIDILGHSWGGMLGSQWAVSNSSGNLRKLILSNTLASMETWIEGLTTLKNQLPEKEIAAIDEAERTKNFTTPEYEAAIDIFYQRHFSLARPWPPPEVEAAIYWLTKDPTTYGTMYGPSELTTTGSLRDWTVIPDLHKIKVPTLLINGAQDEAQDVAMQPFFDKIPNVKWITFDNAAHLAYVDQKDKYMTQVQRFLNN